MLALQEFRVRLGTLVRRLVRQTHGQDLIEYGVLVAMIAAGVILAASQIGVKVPGYYTNAAEALPGGSPSGPPGRGGNPGNGNPGNGNPVGNPGGNPGN